MKEYLNKLVIVKWGDAFEHIGKNYKLPYKDHLTITVGYVADICKRRIYLSMFRCGISKKLASPFVAIPKKMIESIKRLKR